MRRYRSNAARTAAQDLELGAEAFERQVAIVHNLRRQLDGYVLAFLAAGGSEVAAARLSGLSRPTVRKIAGKLPPADRDPEVPGQLAIVQADVDPTCSTCGEPIRIQPAKRGRGGVVHTSTGLVPCSK